MKKVEKNWMELKKAAWEREQKDRGIAQEWQHLGIHIFTWPNIMDLQMCNS